jgi:hypothetical protein
MTVRKLVPVNAALQVESQTIREGEFPERIYVYNYRRSDSPHHRYGPGRDPLFVELLWILISCANTL